MVVVVLVGGGEARGVDDEVAGRGAADGGGCGGEEHEADERGLDHRREVEVEAEAEAESESAPRHLI